MSLPGPDPRAAASPTARKILVAYFSHGGNTRAIAHQIAEATGAGLFEIAPVSPYTTDYDAVVAQARRELAADLRPALLSAGPDLRDYEVIFVGSPNWWSTVAPPVMTFLAAHPLAGKTVVPFLTHEGSRLGNSARDVRRLCPGAAVLAGGAFQGGSAQNARDDVRRWLRDLKLLK